MNYNAFMIALLRSSLHWILSGSFMLITYTGRKSGKSFTLPVNYQEMGDKLLIISKQSRSWWRNMRGGEPVIVRLRGQERSAQAETVDSPAAVAGAFETYFQAAPKMARYFDVKLDLDGKPFPADLEKAAAERVAVWIKLA